MANMKQDGSNITSCEFFTGRCRINCEQCFVNFGQTGGTIVKNIMDPRKLLPGARGSTRNWIKYASTVEDSRGNRLWAPPKKGTIEIPRSGTGFKGLSDGEFARLAELDWPRLTDESAYMIPKVPDPLAKKRPRTRLVVGNGSLPYFLRVSSQSDSARSPLWWCQQVLAAWGDFCFFNVNIRSAAAPDAIDHWEQAFHKVVVTVNGGHQVVPHVKQFGQKPGVSLSEIMGSMGDRHPADFLSPMSITSAGLPAAYESQVKFYRLRVLPTIAPHFEVDAPVVKTALRFLSIPHALEFARKYGISIRCEVRSKKDIEACEAYSAPYQVLPQGHPTRILLSLDSRENGSPRRGETTEMLIESNYYRSNGEEYAHEEYVCDRAHLSCVACGLCASLDGTQKGDINWLNVFKTDDGREVVMAPEPYGADYLPPTKKGKNTNYYASLFSAKDGGWVANPEIDTEWIAGSLEEVAEYLTQGLTPDGNACESWNTHEDVATLTAFCYFQALRVLKNEGVSKGAAIARVEAWFSEVADAHVLSEDDDLREMWDGDSKWNDLFGDI